MAACGRGDTDFESEWRAQAREKFGAYREDNEPPPGFEGRPFRYVEYAHYICDQGGEVVRKKMTDQLGKTGDYRPYEDSLEQFIVETFCPYRDQDGDNNFLG